jgi:hypothetical protein
MSVRLEVLKTTAGFYVWRIVRGDLTVYQSLEFMSAKGAAASLDQVIASVMRALTQKSVEIHNLTGEEI